MNDKLQHLFTEVYRKNGWHSRFSKSGHGSSLAQTGLIRHQLPRLLMEYDVDSLLDIPCGDYYWFSEVAFPSEVQYIGADIVPELIAENRQKYPDIDFRVLDITTDHLPTSDIVLVRDCFGHFSNANIQKALDNIKRSGSRYLLATNFYNPLWDTKGDGVDSGWRPINLGVQFGLGRPLESMNEHLTAYESLYRDKSLALWKL